MKKRVLKRRGSALFFDARKIQRFRFLIFPIFCKSKQKMTKIHFFTISNIDY